MLQEKDIMKLQNGSDVRGVAVEGVADEPVTLTPEAVNRIAGGFVKFLSKKLGKAAAELRIAVGHDSRISAGSLKAETLKAITAAGAHAVDCGLASTPAMFMSIVYDETYMDGSIMITASHLPFNRNGMKFFTKDGGLEKAEVKSLLAEAVETPEAEADISGVEKYDIISLYAGKLVENIRGAIGAGDTPLKGMHIVVDAGNGGGGFFESKVLKPLGADTEGSLYLEPDGMFPNHIPNPENEKAMAAISGAVVENKADLGLIFDTDVDRMSAVLSNGREVNRNALIAMMAAILQEDYPGSTIVTDSVTSDELTEFLEGLGLKHHRYMRGYKNVINECIRLNNSGTVSPLAIETSGHGALSENYYLDDGAYLAVKLLIAAAKANSSGHPIEKLIENLGEPAESCEYRIKIVGAENPREYGEGVLSELKTRAEAKNMKMASPSYEGIRFVFPEGWALIRVSLHDPNMPLNIESRNPGGCNRILAELKELFKGFEKLDISVLG